MILSLLIITTVKSVRCAANDLTQLGVFVVALTVVSGVDWQSNLGAQDPFSSVASSFNPKTTIGGAEADPTKRLREGTLIPPTEGRIVMLGRRWAFVPSAYEVDSSRRLAEGESPRSLASTYTDRSRPTRLGTRGESPREAEGVDRLIVGAIGGEESTAARKDGSQIEAPHIVIVENLLLQRIVTAIRADSADDRWTVTGQVTEFFNENRLMLQTAHRANAN